MANLTSDVKISLASNIRSATDEEVRFFRENGWVKMDGLMSRELAEELCQHITQVAEFRGGRTTHEEIESAYKTAEANGLSGVNFRESDEFIDRLATCPELGEVTAQLLGTQPLRLWSDSVFGKLGGGGDQHGTPWHQDYPSLPYDRAIGAQLWFACVEITPDMGPLQHLSGSHREPPLGRGEGGPNGMVDVYPWLLEKYASSPQFHLQPGDALAHHALTFHSAQPNRTDTDRIAWASHRFDARARYTGLVNDRSDGRGLTVGEPFDHPFFPIVTE